MKTKKTIEEYHSFDEWDNPDEQHDAVTLKFLNFLISELTAIQKQRNAVKDSALLAIFKELQGRWAKFSNGIKEERLACLFLAHVFKNDYQMIDVYFKQYPGKLLESQILLTWKLWKDQGKK